MKDLAERVLARLPAYLPDLAAMVAHPKRTIIARSSGADDDLRNALIFVALTVGLGFLLQAPTLPAEIDFIETAAAMAAYKVVAILLFSAVIHGLFRLVRGKAGFLRTLTAYIYMVSPLYLALVVLTLVSQGLLRAYDPELGLALRRNPLYFAENPEVFTTFQDQEPLLAGAVTVVNTAGNFATLVWFIVCLGAFRAIHDVTRRRSALAGVLIVIAWWPYAFAILFLAIGMFGRMAPPLT